MLWVLGTQVRLPATVRAAVPGPGKKKHGGQQIGHD